MTLRGCPRCGAGDLSACIVRRIAVTYRRPGGKRYGACEAPNVGTYDTPTLLSIIVSGYVSYIFTGEPDTPFVYPARRMKETGKVPN